MTSNDDNKGDYDGPEPAEGSTVAGYGGCNKCDCSSYQHHSLYVCKRSSCNHRFSDHK